MTFVLDCNVRGDDIEVVYQSEKAINTKEVIRESGISGRE